MARFRWNRERYRKADSLFRLLERRVHDDRYDPPYLVSRYLSLWQQHRQHNDPLLQSTVHHRLALQRDEIPF